MGRKSERLKVVLVLPFSNLRFTVKTPWKKKELDARAERERTRRDADGNHTNEPFGNLRYTVSTPWKKEELDARAEWKEEKGGGRNRMRRQTDDNHHMMRGYSTTQLK